VRRGRLLKDWVVDRWINLDLFNSKQQPIANGCVEWTGVRSNVGYGFVGFNYGPGKTSPSGLPCGMMTAHRLAWMLHHNRLPTLPNINHTCHNKLCVNPDHLEEGTQREKLDEMSKAGIKGGRTKGQTGYAYNHIQHNRVYKYSTEEIQWIRTAPVDAIMERYGLERKRAAARRLAFRHGYTWLPCPPFEKDKTGPKPKRNK
jgi:HNH endonuclease